MAPSGPSRVLTLRLSDKNKNKGKMKNLLKAALVVIALGVNAFDVNAQTVLGNPPPSLPYIKDHIDDRKPIPYTHLREADVMWSKTIWRVLDLSEKQNLPLYYPITPINDWLSLF